MKTIKMKGFNFIKYKVRFFPFVKVTQKSGWETHQ